MIQLSTKQKKFTKEKSKYFSGTGRRKSATARVRIIKGTGDVIINSQELLDYFVSPFIIKKISEPLKLLGLDKKVDISILVSGGGKSAQVDAIRLGISRAIIRYNSDFKPTLKKSGFLTRDAREKERKKPGLKRARRAPQWKKR
ncbi:30S ribosomal protein S9 [subsurface metagenome]